jgi:hypothetical protein
MRRPLTAVLALALSSLLPISANAVPDFAGDAGQVAELEILQSSADRYLQFHGRVVIRLGDRQTEYKWGGTHCSNRTLTEATVAALQRAHLAGATVQPRYVAGQGLNRCVAGFTQTFP